MQIDNNESTRLFESYKAKFKLWLKWYDSGWCYILHSSILEAIDKFIQKDADIQSLLNKTFKLLINMNDSNARLITAIGLPRAAEYLDKSNINHIAHIIKTEKDYRIRCALGQSLATNMPRDKEKRDVFINCLMRLFENQQDLEADERQELNALVACAILDNATECGEKLENIAASFTNRNYPSEVRRRVAWAIASNFNALSEITQNALIKLTKSDEDDTWVRISAGEAVADNIEQNPKALEKVIIELLHDTKYPQVQRSIIGAIEYNLQDLSDKFRSELIQLSDKYEPAVIEWLIWAVMNNFDDLHEEFYESFQAFAGHEDPRVRKWVAEALVDNFQNLNDDYMALLRTLIEDRNEIVRTAACNFTL
ncbi:MAG: hypothetical protein AB1480_07220 [Nitrospirota bacterium]